MRAALKTSDLGDLARTHADAVRDSGNGARAELGDFCSQLHKADPEACKRWRTALKKELPDETERMGRALNLVNLEDAAEGDKQAFRAINDDLRDTLSTARPSKEGEVEVAAVQAVPLMLMSLPLLVGAGIVTQQNADKIAAGIEAGQQWAFDTLNDLLGRTDIAEPLPTTETLPEDRPDPAMDKETLPQADPISPLPPSEQQTIEQKPETLPDQSEETTADDLILHITPTDPTPVEAIRDKIRNNPDGLTSEENLLKDGLDTLDNRSPEQREVIEERLPRHYRIDGGNNNGLSIDTGENRDRAGAFFDDLVRDLGGDPSAASPIVKPDYEGKVVKLPDGTRVRYRDSSHDGRPTVEYEKPRGGKDKPKWSYKWRFGNKTKEPFMRK